eukprot:8018746-Pyramimonas_sp.AAC.1
MSELPWTDSATIEECEKIVDKLQRAAGGANTEALQSAQFQCSLRSWRVNPHFGQLLVRTSKTCLRRGVCRLAWALAHSKIPADVDLAIKMLQGVASCDFLYEHGVFSHAGHCRHRVKTTVFDSHVLSHTSSPSQPPTSNDFPRNREYYYTLAGELRWSSFGALGAQQTEFVAQYRSHQYINCRASVTKALEVCVPVTHLYISTVGHGSLFVVGSNMLPRTKHRFTASTFNLATNLQVVSSGASWHPCQGEGNACIPEIGQGGTSNGVVAHLAVLLVHLLPPAIISGIGPNIRFDTATRCSVAADTVHKPTTEASWIPIRRAACLRRTYTYNRRTHDIQSCIKNSYQEFAAAGRMRRLRPAFCADHSPLFPPQRQQQDSGACVPPKGASARRDPLYSGTCPVPENGLPT